MSICLYIDIYIYIYESRYMSISALTSSFYPENAWVSTAQILRSTW